MTKTYAILQKKLQELELQLSHNNITPSIIHPSDLSQENHQKLLFIANLLSAETASCPTKPRHLKHIARRLAQLEATFRYSGTENLLGHVDDSSTCSCTESCLNDDGEVVSHASSCLDDEEESGEFYECQEVEKEEMIKEDMMMVKDEARKIVGVRKLCGAMANGLFICMALMGVAISFIEIFGYLQVQPNGGFVTPT